MLSTLHSSTSHHLHANHHHNPHHYSSSNNPPTIFDHLTSPTTSSTSTTDHISAYPHPHLLRSSSSHSVARIQTSGLDSVGLSAPYSLRNHLEQQNANGSSFSSVLQKNGIGPIMKTPTKASRNSFPYDASSAGGGKSAKDLRHHKNDEKTSGPVRRRISRACDQCNQLRTKCDGRSPCAHCVEFNLACEYFRERKKRGKASRKDIAQQQAAAAAVANGSGADDGSPTSPTYSDTGSNFPQIKEDGTSPSMTSRPELPGRSMSATSENGAMQPANGIPRSGSYGAEQMQTDLAAMENGHIDQDAMDQGANGMVNGYGYQQQMVAMQAQPSMHGSMITPLGQPLGTPTSYVGYPDTGFPMMTAGDQNTDQYPFPRGVGSPITNFMAQSPSSVSGTWLPMPSPGSGSFPLGLGMQNTLRYPVLKPIIATVKKIIPESLACDLLDFYFASSSSAHHHPQSPMLLAVIFRKKSFLHPTNPRQCSPALLASMLWVAAQNCEAPFLTSPPSARSRICSKLLDITISHLKPLIHGANDISPIMAMNSAVHGVTLSGLGVTASGEQVNEDCGPNATVDDVATYCHLATVVSASEYKAASLRWWTAAWSLARELKLGRELPPNPEPSRRESAEPEQRNGEGEVNMTLPDANPLGGSETPTRPGVYTEEDREERRRIWWLLYTVDRHLSLCYNKPLFLLDSECFDLLQPVPERRWQSGEQYTVDEFSFQETTRHRGPTFTATSHSIFGYFTPLMTILGEIVELNQARNHPRFGVNFRAATDWDQQVNEIRQHLDIYESSLKEFEMKALDPEYRQEVGTPSARSVNSNGSRVNESFLQTKTVVAYGTHVLHVLHILLHGKWDPILLLDDSDLWISSPSFPDAMRHAVNGAEAIAAILDYDPDLSYMPFFFGIYLLQGSFLLLLIADKLQAGANPNVVNACETVVRAVEACVVTLNTEYQRNFRKVMRSVLAQVKGRFPDDFGEQEQRRREVLSLYRWTSDGTGLAL